VWLIRTNFFLPATPLWRREYRCSLHFLRSPWPSFQVAFPFPFCLCSSLTQFQVVVKWQGKKFDIELDTTESGSTFKFQIFSLTGVPPERQKVLIKGGQLKDDQDMSLLSLKPGHSFMLLGTAEQGFKPPEKKTVFLEDMSTAEIAKSVRAWFIFWRC
jgi:Ubiquitin family